MESRRFRRTDIWREGKWLDLWSLVHLASGVSIGLGFGYANLGALPTTIIVFLLLGAYEMWEALVGIAEAPTNRFMDVVVGMTSFTPTFFWLAPLFSRPMLLVVFVGVLALNIAGAALGWYESQKALEFEKRMRARYELQRLLILKRRKQLRERFRQPR